MDYDCHLSRCGLDFDDSRLDKTVLLAHSLALPKNTPVGAMPSRTDVLAEGAGAVLPDIRLKPDPSGTSAVRHGRCERSGAGGRVRRYRDPSHEVEAEGLANP